jgi:hypothetical protein
VDFLGLLRFESSLQIEVVEKIIDFLSKKIHRAIFYLKCQGMTKELEPMWCGPTIGPNDKPPLHQVQHFHVFGSIMFHLNVLLCSTFDYISFKCFIMF